MPGSRARVGVSQGLSSEKWYTVPAFYGAGTASGPRATPAGKGWWPSVGRLGPPAAQRDFGRGLPAVWDARGPQGAAPRASFTPRAREGQARRHEMGPYQRDLVLVDRFPIRKLTFGPRIGTNASSRP